MAYLPAYPIHTIVYTAQCIAQGEDPWFALSNFLHDWWCDAALYRQELIAEPPALALDDNPTTRRWVAFCAATVEELCLRTSFPCPTWVFSPEYTLDQPWFYYSQPSQRDWLLTTTPEPFKRRNIFVGATVLDNKYELEKQFGTKFKGTLWSDQELQQLQYRPAQVD